MDPSEQRILRLRRRERRRELRNFILIASNWLSLPFFALFSIADYYYARDKFWEFATIRLIVVPSCLLVNSAVRKTYSLAKIQRWGCFHVFVNSILVTIMAYIAEGKGSPYYAGLNMCTIIVGTFIPWTTGGLIANFAIIYGPFYALAFILDRGQPNSALIVNSFFMGATIVLTAVARHFNELYRMSAIRSRVALDDELSRRAQVIKEKSEEALSLAELAKQFSPQVVHAIRSGEMQISDSVKESEICVSFMDVCESTSAMQTVGVEAYQNAMELFLSISVPILFKYDVTFDKMIGDAIMSFSNEPAKRVDYVARMAAACLEIREAIAAQETKMARFWGRPFRLKMGLASGAANVGFQGPIVRSYTATGMVVNKANRICAAASPGQILLDGSMIEALSAHGFQTRMLGAKALKDLGEQELYELEGFGAAENARWATVGAEACRVCGTILHLEENAAGILILKCGNCGLELS
jgi:class 3 adenylate cyclase